MLNEAPLQGLIIKAQSGFFTVDTGQGLIVCQLHGKLKQGKAVGDLAALGDRVRITVSTDGSGAIEEVEERKQALVRLGGRLGCGLGASSGCGAWESAATRDWL